MKKDLIPKSKAKTAYGLLSEVRKLILEEPKRYDQGIYIARINGANDSVDLRSEYRQEPACGTVACVAGWVATLKRGSKFGYDEADEIASEIPRTQRIAINSPIRWWCCSGLQTDARVRTGWR
jgi:hypothetical protein